MSDSTVCPLASKTATASSERQSLSRIRHRHLRVPCAAPSLAGTRAIPPSFAPGQAIAINAVGSLAQAWNESTQEVEADDQKSHAGVQSC